MSRPGINDYLDDALSLQELQKEQGKRFAAQETAARVWPREQSRSQSKNAKLQTNPMRNPASARIKHILPNSLLSLSGFV